MSSKKKENKMSNLYKDLIKALDNKTLDYSYRDFEAKKSK